MVLTQLSIDSRKLHGIGIVEDIEQDWIDHRSLVFSRPSVKPRKARDCATKKEPRGPGILYVGLII
jgi:hypothetical protein